VTKPIQFHLFYEPDAGDTTIIAVIADRYGLTSTMPQNTFFSQGLKTIREVIASFSSDPKGMYDSFGNNRGYWDVYIKKPRMLVLQPSTDGAEGTIHVLHTDDHWKAGPLDYGPAFVISLEQRPERFAQEIFKAFAMSKDFAWVPFSLREATSFFCLYQRRESELYYWFDWVMVDLPKQE
jgi:hypothetical protein